MEGRCWQEPAEPTRSVLSESDTVSKYILHFTFEILSASDNKFEEIRYIAVLAALSNVGRALRRSLK